MEFTQLNQNVEDYYANTQQQIEGYQETYRQDISDYETQISNQISGYNTNYQATLNAERQIVADFVDKDFVICNSQTGEAIPITFTNKVYRHTDARITSNTLVDVYFTSETYYAALDSLIRVKSYNGYFEIECIEEPSVTLYAIIRVRVR